MRLFTLFYTRLLYILKGLSNRKRKSKYCNFYFYSLTDSDNLIK